MRPPTLSVIVLNYRAGELLLRCLESVFADPTDFEVEVILIDNASPDDSFERARARFGDRLCHAVRNPRNGGFAYGNNVGLRLSRGEFVAVLNPDTRVHPGSFAALVAKLRADPKIGFVGPRVLTPDGEDEWSAQRMIPGPFDALARGLGLTRLLPSHPRWSRFEAGWLEPAVSQAVEASTGCCMVARRTMLDQIGHLDERFFIYCEDLDWFIRARDAGWQVHYVAEAVVEHQHAYSAKFRRYRSVYDHHASMIRFYRKHYAARYPSAVNWAMYAGVAARMGLLMGHRAATAERGFRRGPSSGSGVGPIRPRGPRGRPSDQRAPPR